MATATEASGHGMELEDSCPDCTTKMEDRGDRWVCPECTFTLMKRYNPL